MSKPKKPTKTVTAKFGRGESPIQFDLTATGGMVLTTMRRAVRFKCELNDSQKQHSFERYAKSARLSVLITAYVFDSRKRGYVLVGGQDARNYSGPHSCSDPRYYADTPEQAVELMLKRESANLQVEKRKCLYQAHRCKAAPALARKAAAKYADLDALLAEAKTLKQKTEGGAS